MKAARLLAITLLLQARGKMTAEELGRELEVSERTIYRDIAALGAARVPVMADSGPSGGYSIAGDYRLDPTLFSGDEAVSLAIGGAILRGLREVELTASLQQALAKIEAALPPEHRDSVRAGRQRFLFDGAAWYATTSLAPPHLPILRSAVLHGRRVRLRYQRRDATEAEERDVDPLGLVYKAGIWYLVGHCFSRGALRTFRVGRIVAVESLAAPRDAYPDFDLARYWGESTARLEARNLFPVVLRVDAPMAADFLERPLTFLRVARCPDGSVEAEIDLDSPQMAMSFVLGFGPHGEVLAPDTLRQAVLAVAMAIAQRHRD
jgi:predicted DNA-binding transcriptional regulator YafY